MSENPHFHDVTCVEAGRLTGALGAPGPPHDEWVNFEFV